MIDSHPSIRQRRLTDWTEFGGCAAKAGAVDLEHILAVVATDPSCAELVVGLREPDDAAVFTVAGGTAVVCTVDLFPPIVDDPVSYGAVSAANALSDVYAMGAVPVLALNILAYPPEFDQDSIDEILIGGASKVAEAGAILAGGHTLLHSEPLYGLCALGVADPRHILRKSGAMPGDVLYLTKPIGTGLVLTAAKFGEADPQHTAEAIASMSALNAALSALAVQIGAHSMTDVTGFGLLGHAYEMVRLGRVGLEVHAEAVPLLLGAYDYACRGLLTGGGHRNRVALEGKVEIASAVRPDIVEALFDPQTSGGLLVSIDPDSADEFTERARDVQLPVWKIGTFISGPPCIVLT